MAGPAGTQTPLHSLLGAAQRDPQHTQVFDDRAVRDAAESALTGVLTA